MFSVQAIKNAELTDSDGQLRWLQQNVNEVK